MPFLNGVKKLPCCYLECCRRVWFRNFFAFCLWLALSCKMRNAHKISGAGSAHETHMFCTHAGWVSEFGQNQWLEDLQVSRSVCPCIKIKHILCDKQLCVNLVRRMKCFTIRGIYFTHPSSKESTENVGKGEAPSKIKMLTVMGWTLCHI